MAGSGARRLSTKMVQIGGPMPRRSDASVRVGLNCIVRSSRTSNVSNVSGPETNAWMSELTMHDYYEFIYAAKPAAPRT